MDLPISKKTIFLGLSKPNLISSGIRALGRLQGLFFKRVIPGGMRSRFPLGLKLRRVIPPLALVSFKDMVANHHTVNRPRAKVALFTGCLNNYVFPETGLAVLKILKANRVEVVIPPRQHCCGAPLLYGGETKISREMAQSQVNLFHSEQVEAIITACGTCGESFKIFYPEILDGLPGYARKALELAAKTFDIVQFLSLLSFDKNLWQPVEWVVTYHQPCHLGRGLGVIKEPVEIIQSIPGVKFSPLKEPESCCGNAGLFGLYYYRLACEVRKSKLRDIAGTGADVVVTGCPACRMHIIDGICQAGMNKRVMHTAELLAASLGNT